MRLLYIRSLGLFKFGEHGTLLDSTEPTITILDTSRRYYCVCRLKSRAYDEIT